MKPIDGIVSDHFNNVVFAAINAFNSNIGIIVTNGNRGFNQMVFIINSFMWENLLNQISKLEVKSDAIVKQYKTV